MTNKYYEYSTEEFMHSAELREEFGVWEENSLLDDLSRVRQDLEEYANTLETAEGKIYEQDREFRNLAEALQDAFNSVDEAIDRLMEAGLSPREKGFEIAEPLEPED